jgi:glycosyltransferase involved in cell wall biosynthesis
VALLGMGWLAPYAGAAPNVPAVVDEHNYEPMMAAREAQRRHHLGRLKWTLFTATATRAERRNLRTVRGVSAVSEIEARLFRSIAPHADVAVVPNGVDTKAFRPAPPGAGVVMTGSMLYGPNLDGAGWMAREVWPRVQAECPDAELRLVGVGGETALRGLVNLPGVRVVGTVADVRPELARATVAVAPIRYGAGTRIKILEALAAGRATVATRLAAEGLEVTDGKDILLRDEAASFADAVVCLLKDETLAASLGTQGRDLAERRYDWRVSAEALEALLARVARS